MNKQRLYGLDFVKGFSIIWICLYHLLDFRNNWKLGINFNQGTLFHYFSENSGIIEALIKTFLSLGIIGVNIFVIASGLGLALSKNSKDINVFFKRRVLKIFPPYWIILTTILVSYLIKGTKINYLDFLTHYIGINTFFPEFLFSLSTPLWFVGIILQLYLLFPIIQKTSKKLNPIIFLGLTLLLKIYLSPFLTNLFGGGRFFTEFIVEFYFGIHLGHLLIQQKINLNSKRLTFFIIPGLIGLYTLITFDSNLTKFIFPATSIVLFLGLFPIGQYLKNKWIIRFSTITYSLYLSHYLVLTKLMPKISRLPFAIESIVFLSLSFIAATTLTVITLKLNKGFNQE